MVAQGGHAWLLPGGWGHVWLLPGGLGACVVALGGCVVATGGMHGKGGMCGKLHFSNKMSFAQVTVDRVSWHHWLHDTMATTQHLIM